MSSRVLSRLTALCIGILLLGNMPAWSQATSTGAISGLVTDQSGAVVPSAQVTLLDTGTAVAIKTATNDAGRYIILNVPSGNYVLTVMHEGFSQEKISNVIMTVGASLTVNAQLKIGATTETITVEAHVLTELQTTNATIGNTIDSKSIQLLPNLGRDTSTLASLQPAVTGAGYTAGVNYDQNTYMLDGGNITDDMGGQTISYQQNMTGTGGTQESGYASGVVPTPIESIEEIKVSVAGQGIDFNNSSGASVQMVTKRGTNQFHGSVYEYYFDTTLGSANTWANNHTIINGAPNPLVSNHRNRFGFAFGGPISPKKILGGRTYFFVNYEGLRFPNVGSYEHITPTPLMRAGVIQIANSAGQYLPYNLSSNPVTVGGVTYAPALCGAVSCDPRGLGIDPTVATIWNKYMPLPNDYTGASGDTYNTAGYLSAIRQSQTSAFWVGRIDHDFGDKNRFFMSYRYFGFKYLTSNQGDIGGAIAGDSFGQPAATAPRPQKPSFLVFGLTSNLTPSITNDLRVSYTRTWWQWSDVSPQTAPLIPGQGGAIEIAGGLTATAEGTSTTGYLIPYNVNTQSTRTRFWDGQDKQLRDDLSMVRGNHLFQFGASYQRDFDYHSRNDNGLSIDVNPTYIIQSGGITFPTTGTGAVIPSTVPSSQYTNYEDLYSEVLGLVAQSQVTYSRSGANLAINPIGTPAFDQSVIPYYNVYFGDSWHLKPSLTLVYGLAWALEMPPYEINGKQIDLVDASGQQLSTQNYLAAKQSAALQGINYNPQVGYALVGNIGSGLKYPYNPFYGEFSPRVALAWNPTFSDGILGKILGQSKTVIRGGYSRIYGRLNGVGQVLVPLLGPGFLQGVACTSVLANGTCGTVPSTPSSVFRMGTDGLVAPLAAPTATLPQPYFPGTSGFPNAGDVNTLDPNFRPDRTDTFTLSIQRQINNRMNFEIGYIGRITKNEFQEIDLDAVPTMFTLGGQTFAQAYGALYTQECSLSNPTCVGNPISSITPQPFFEAALGGASSTYCKGYASCTAAILSNSTNLGFLKNNAVNSLWLALNNASSWVPGKTTMSELGQLNAAALSTSLGFSNYNALYVTYRVSDWHGLTLQSNFTWGRALGTAGLAQLNSGNTAANPFNLQSNYGPQSYDIPFTYNLLMYYQPPFFKTQKGIVGRVLGGWTFAPLFTAQSGNPAVVGSTSGDTFGEVASPSSSFTSTADGNAVALSSYTGTNSRNLNVAGTQCTNCAGTPLIGGTNPTGQNMYTNPGAIYGEFRPCVMGVDTNCGGYTGGIRSLPVWNVDATIAKDFSMLKEDRLGVTLIFQITNVFNHMQPGAPSLSLTAPTTFGRITSQANTPRNMEFGLRIHF